MTHLNLPCLPDPSSPCLISTRLACLIGTRHNTPTPNGPCLPNRNCPRLAVSQSPCLQYRQRSTSLMLARLQRSLDGSDAAQNGSDILADTLQSHSSSQSHRSVRTALEPEQLLL